MTGSSKSEPYRKIDPASLRAMLGRGSALLIDVREAEEFAEGHIPGAVNMPLSAFSPDAIPDAAGRTVVLQCVGGKRSGMALDRCAEAQSLVETHLAGGINAWKEAGFPVVAG